MNLSYSVLTAKQDMFWVEKIIRKDPKKRQALAQLVKWKGYRDD